MIEKQTDQQTNGQAKSKGLLTGLAQSNHASHVMRKPVSK